VSNTKQQSSSGFLLFTAVLLSGMYLTRDATLNQQAPVFSLPETYGGRVDSGSYRGRPVLLVFWMTSCGICRRELPLLSDLAPEFRSKGVDVVAIHLGSVEEARNYMRSNHINLTSLVDSEGSVGQAYRVSGVPKLVLIDHEGKIKRTTAGMADETVLREWMDVVSGS
jgi:methylamine dehydrogenase accessory protein MauD